MKAFSFAARVMHSPSAISRSSYFNVAFRNFKYFVEAITKNK